MSSAKEISSILLLCLAVGCKHTEPVSRHVDASLERMIPAETQFVDGKSPSVQLLGFCQSIRVF